MAEVHTIDCPTENQLVNQIINRLHKLKSMDALRAVENELRLVGDDLRRSKAHEPTEGSK